MNTVTNEQWLTAAICEIAFNGVEATAIINAVQLSQEGVRINGAKFDAAIQASIKLSEILCPSVQK